jgi:hypothetical protein
MPDQVPGDLDGALARVMEMARLQQQAEQAELAMRRNVLRWASVLCGCRWPDWPVRGDVSPPQAGCVVHGGVMVSFDGTQVL